MNHKNYNGSLTIAGEYYNRTTLDGCNSMMSFGSIGTNSKVSLINLTLVNGYCYNWETDFRVGSINLHGELNIDNCIFENHKTYTIFNMGECFISNSIFRNNDGVDIFIHDYTPHPMPQMNSSFINNTFFSSTAISVGYYNVGLNIIGNKFISTSNNNFLSLKMGQANLINNTFIRNFNSSDLPTVDLNNAYLENNRFFNYTNEIKGIIQSLDTWNDIKSNSNYNVNLTFRNTLINSSNIGLICEVSDDVGNYINGGHVNFYIDDAFVGSSTSINGVAKFTSLDLYNNGNYLLSGDFGDENKLKTNNVINAIITFDFNFASLDVWVSPTKGNDTTGDGSEENPFRTLDTAINYGLSQSFCIIVHLGNGVYEGDGNQYLTYSSIGNITLVGESYGNVIFKGMYSKDYQNDYALFGFTNRNALVKLINISFTDIVGGELGAISFQSSVIIDKCIFYGISSYLHLIYTYGETTTISNCTFKNGSGMFIKTGSYETNILNNTFIDINTDSTDDNGGLRSFGGTYLNVIGNNFINVGKYIGFTSSNGRIINNTFNGGVLSIFGNHYLENNLFYESDDLVKGKMELYYWNTCINFFITSKTNILTSFDDKLNFEITDDAGNVVSGQFIDVYLNETLIGTINPHNGIASLDAPLTLENGIYNLGFVGRYQGNCNFKIISPQININYNLTYNDVWVSPQGSDTYGNGSESNPYKTIQKAVNSVIRPQVHIKNGIYSGEGNTNLTITQGSSLALIGESYGNVIIDGENKNYMFYFEIPKVIINNLTFINSIDYPYHNTKLLLINNTIFRDSGYIYFNSINFTLNNVSFANVNGIRLPNGEIYNSRFENMTVSRYKEIEFGYSNVDHMIIKNSRFSNFTYYDTDDRISIWSENIISENNIFDSVGSIYSYGKTFKSVNDTFSNNNIINPNYGVLYVKFTEYYLSDSCIVINDTFINNSAKSSVLKVSGSKLQGLNFINNTANNIIYIFRDNQNSDYLFGYNLIENITFKNNEGNEIFVSDEMFTELIYDLTVEFKNGNMIYANIIHPSGAKITGGTVTFKLNNTVIGTSKVINGTAALKVDNLSDGVYIVSGEYSLNASDTNFVNTTIIIGESVSNIVTPETFSEFFNSDGTLKDTINSELIFNGEFNSLVNQLIINRPVTLTGNSSVLNNIDVRITCDNVVVQGFIFKSHITVANVKNINITNNTINCTGKSNMIIHISDSKNIDFSDNILNIITSDENLLKASSGSGILFDNVDEVKFNRNVINISLNADSNLIVVDGNGISFTDNVIIAKSQADLYILNLAGKNNLISNNQIEVTATDGVVLNVIEGSVEISDNKIKTNTEYAVNIAENVNYTLNSNSIISAGSEAINDNRLIETILEANDITSYYTVKTKYIATLKDINGISIVNKTITININGQVFNRITDSNGIVTLELEYNTGSYLVSAYYLGDNKYLGAYANTTLIIKAYNIVTSETFFKFFNNDGSLKDNYNGELVFNGEFKNLVEKITINRPIIVNGNNSVLINMGIKITSDNVTVCGFIFKSDNLNGVIDVNGNKNINITDNEVNYTGNLANIIIINNSQNINFNGNTFNIVLQGKNLLKASLDNENAVLSFNKVSNLDFNNNVINTNANVDSVTIAINGSDIEFKDNTVNVKSSANLNILNIAGDDTVISNNNIKMDAYKESVALNILDGNININGNYLNVSGNAIVSNADNLIVNNNMILADNLGVDLQSGNATIYNNTINTDGEYAINIAKDVNCDVSNNLLKAGEKTSENTIDDNNIIKVILEADDIIMYYKDGTRYWVTLKDVNGNILVNSTVIININGLSYNRTTDANGSASIGLNLNSGTYEVTTSYLANGNFSNALINNTVVIKSTVDANDIIKIYKNATQFYATFTDKIGKTLANHTEVTFNINGVMYKRYTNEMGIARLNINLNPESYIITAINPETGEMATNNVTVLPNIINNKDLTKYYKNASQYIITLLDDSGNVVASGVSVVFNINGVFYTRSTNESGQAKLNINLNPGEYIITAEYNGLKLSNSIKVISILYANNLNMKYKDGSKFEVKLLNPQGKVYTNQYVLFNVNGVFYQRVTDENGVAKLNINLMAGEYIITSTFDGCNVANTITISG